MRPNTATFVLLLFVGSFALRVCAVPALRDIHTGPQGIASADDVEFNNLALRVCQGKGYVGDQGQLTSFRAPGWPLFLAGLYWLAGPCVPLVYVVLCLLGGLSCVLTYLLARIGAGRNGPPCGTTGRVLFTAHLFLRWFPFGKPLRGLSGPGHLAVFPGSKTGFPGPSDARGFDIELGDPDAAILSFVVADAATAIRYPLSAIRWERPILADGGIHPGFLRLHRAVDPS